MRGKCRWWRSLHDFGHFIYYVKCEEGVENKENETATGFQLDGQGPLY